MEIERIKSIDFVRASCAIGIICIHFAIESGNPLLTKILTTFPSGKGILGRTLVTVFFMLSGLCLQLKNRETSAREFFRKRALSVYPSYYICWIFAFFLMVFKGEAGNFIKSRAGISILLTLIGIDGYMHALIPTNWYLVGEWFLGALLMLYAIYPTLRFCFEKFEFITIFVIFTAFAVLIDCTMLKQSAFRNITSCTISFFVGMMISKYKLHNSNLMFKVSLISFTLLFFLPMNMDSNIKAHICGLFMFFALNGIGDRIMRNHIANTIVSWVSNNSFEMFLLQHIIIKAFIKQFSVSKTSVLCCFLLLIIIIICLIAGLIKKLRNVIIENIEQKRLFQNP